MYGYIYCITNKINGKQYVGQTTQAVSQRFSGHISEPDERMAIARAIIKYGKENFSVETLDQANSPKELNALEKAYIKIKRSHVTEGGYNIRRGGGYTDYERIRSPMSQETKNKIRIANTGKKASKETRRKLSESHKGNVPGNTGMRYKNHPRTEVTRRNISIATRGKKHPNGSGEKHHSAKRIQCVETKEIFPTITSASIWLKKQGLGTGIWQALTESHRIAGGYHWVYKDK